MTDFEKTYQNYNPRQTALDEARALLTAAARAAMGWISRSSSSPTTSTFATSTKISASEATNESCTLLEILPPSRPPSRQTLHPCGSPRHNSGRRTFYPI